ncbi:phytanoyl-CoA dioxygenase family protein [Talaromyces stipitatus ATCC 10500]|uniref:Phytanoyl-CoA dioxygenase family protein n=1 Tax=Talaromyces stipitatus (strain ATCC 10500 / CBS 375.48 / QM 6759 / NRRL 1006) TaxID=441959 RepID=B8LZ30_TALSN|nr:phytanoyl-CoA dioxygenase family protein [Talaromyces stipitatus ATCC 10500]EED21074.1 phytanoyl-CoA dioxygenase family protein [Talaromyces stipitatus ATCC 10500]
MAVIRRRLGHQVIGSVASRPYLVPSRLDFLKKSAFIDLISPQSRLIIIMGSTTSESPVALHEFDPSPSNAQAVINALIKDGGVIIRNLLSQEVLDQIEKDVRPYIEADKPWKGDFFPPETRRVCGLAGKSPTFMKNIVVAPLYQAVCDALLTSTYHSYYGKTLEKSISKPQLNNTIVFSIGPGARNQELHRDDMIHHNLVPAITAEEYKPGRDTGIGFFIAGKKTTKQNGATRFIPGSHLWATVTEPDEEQAVYAELSPGDGFMMLSSCFHGGSANKTVDEERLVYSCFMTKGYLRQEENQYLANPIEKVREYPVDMQRLIGYQVSQPFLGWLDLDDPRKALVGNAWEDGRGDVLGYEGDAPDRSHSEHPF